MHVEMPKIHSSQNNPEKNKVGELSLPQFQNLLQNSKIVWYRLKDRYTSQWNRTESQGKNLYEMQKKTMSRSYGPRKGGGVTLD